MIYYIWMLYSQRMEQAIRFAIQVHQIDQDQRRKSTHAPYIIHPFSVALILSRIPADEDIVIAGLLHDTIEDCSSSRPITIQQIQLQFGERVAHIVDDLTKKSLGSSWAVRKQEVVDHMLHMSHDSLLVKSADILHNLSDFIEDYKQQGEAIFSKFESTKENYYKLFKERIHMLERVWSEDPLLPQLQEKLQELTFLWK